MLQELKWHPPRWSDNDAGDGLHLAIAHRPIVAAAKGGCLERLSVHASTLEPLAVRSLLPHWVQIEDWGQCEEMSWPWARAAVLLRPLLAHASLWLGTAAASGPRIGRQLTPQNAHSLQAHFQEHGVPSVPTMGRPLFNTDDNPASTCDLYLPWLAEDSKLAGRVSDAWNTVVDGGGADAVQCRCTDCTRILGEVTTDIYRWQKLTEDVHLEEGAA